MNPECLGRGCNYDCGKCVNITDITHSKVIDLGNEYDKE